MTKEARTTYVASQILMELILDHGIPLPELERVIGVNRSQIKDPDAWIPMQSFVRLWQLAIDITGDHALALRLRKDTGLRMVHFVVQIGMHSATLLDALIRLGQYAKFMSETDEFDLSEEGSLVEMAYANTAANHVRWLPEHNFSLGLELGRSLAKDNFNPVKVCFQHANPGYKKVYDEIFRAPILFGQPRNLIIFRKKDLLQSIDARDSYLQKVLTKYVESSINKESSRTSLQEKIREHILACLPDGGPTIETAASAMNMARSTLYRKLKEEGTSFRDLLRETRLELAKNHLCAGMTNSQVAYLIGFSEPSVFQRAFKRWYDISPGEYRKSFQVRDDH